MKDEMTLEWICLVFPSLSLSSNSFPPDLTAVYFSASAL